MPDTNETALEKTFSDLAYSHLRDKSQSLLDYLVGFQMLKQEDDGTRAVGIFGFEIDGDYYYAPIFFLNGEIRGLDSLYSVKSDLFMPLTDGWVNTVINRRQISLGDKDERTKQERGVHVPNYNRLKVIPGGSGAINLKLAQVMMGQNPDLQLLNQIDLTSEIRQAGMSRLFKQALDRSPSLRQAFEGFGYNYFDLSSDIPTGGLSKQAAEEAVVLINSVTDEGVEELTDEQRQQVLEGGTAVIDRRPEISQSVLYRREVQRELQNPTCGSLYDVLWATGEVTPCLVCPISDARNHVFVYCTESEQYCCIDRRKVFVTRAYSQDEMWDWLDKNGKPASEITPREVVVFISRGGESTAGFCIENVRQGLDGITVGQVRDPHYMLASGAHPLTNARGDNGNPEPNAFRDLFVGGNGGPASAVPNVSQRPRDPNQCVKEVLVVDSGGNSPRYTSSQCIVNDKSFRALKINSFRLTEQEEPWGSHQYEKYDEPDYEAILGCADFGDYNTVYQSLDKIAADLKVWRQGQDLNIKTAGLNETARDERQALTILMRKLGMSETDARTVMEQADHVPLTYKLRPTTKVAAQLLALPEVEDQGMGGMLSNFHVQQVPLANINQAQSPDNREFYQYNSPFSGSGQAEGEPNTLATVQRAAQTGEKEVFDAAALGSLIKSHNPTDLVDRFLPTVIAGMDRVGRMLFLIFWHYEDFEERYGEDDLSEFIDNLRAVFEQLGDVVVFAKKRTLSGDPEHYGMGMMPVMEE